MSRVQEGRVKKQKKNKHQVSGFKALMGNVE